MVRVCHTISVLPPFVYILLGGYLIAVQTWTRLHGAIAMTRPEAACQGLIKWLQINIVCLVPGSLLYLVFLSHMAPLTKEALLHRHKWLIVQDLPGIDPVIIQAQGYTLVKKMQPLSQSSVSAIRQNRVILRQITTRGQAICLGPTWCTSYDYSMSPLRTTLTLMSGTGLSVKWAGSNGAPESLQVGKIHYVYILYQYLYWSDLLPSKLWSNVMLFNHNWFCWIFTKNIFDTNLLQVFYFL